ncbi:hypothetical protein OG864_01565 [Streptomyces sp. NBC_00124]|uniref:hypothetical protein n=1 Tax=Streptomyces sp. NBC_00124 TaxID=2975662 RepID=UPI002255B8A0|nr:hypothetical protein [Streptomyces sp. NBC_00124]MCX5357450.1 hypothetical protein [Streptomyces sp. NBC_00124]
MSTNRHILLTGVSVTAAAFLAGACSGAAESTAGQTERSACVHVVDEDTGRTGGACLPTAPPADRVDRTEPRFTHPTKITNPLHPTSEVTQTIMGGQVDGKPFRTEVSLLPGTKTIQVDGKPVQARISQYAAFSDGRIQEVALDWYAQADDDSVWYLGEDVFNYDNGVVADTDGTWQAGRDKAPPAMIMPADPEKGDVYRPENLPEIVFEEVTVRAVDQTVDGPYGKIEGAMTVRELHMDGSTEDKVFAPGYGEFSTGTKGGDLEAVSLAVPTDAKPGPVPPRLTALDRAAVAAHESPGAAAVRQVHSAWDAYRASDAVPDLLERQMERDLVALEKAGDGAQAMDPALRVAQNVTDLRVRYESVPMVDRDRLALWTRQLTIDAKAGNEGGAAGDVTALELVWERVSHDASNAAPVAMDLRKLRSAADAKDMAQLRQLAPELAERIVELKGL